LAVDPKARDNAALVCQGAVASGAREGFPSHSQRVLQEKNDVIAHLVHRSWGTGAADNSAWQSSCTGAADGNSAWQSSRGAGAVEDGNSAWQRSRGTGATANANSAWHGSRGTGAADNSAWHGSWGTGAADDGSTWQVSPVRTCLEAFEGRSQSSFRPVWDILSQYQAPINLARRLTGSPWAFNERPLGRPAPLGLPWALPVPPWLSLGHPWVPFGSPFGPPGVLPWTLRCC